MRLAVLLLACLSIACHNNTTALLQARIPVVDGATEDHLQPIDDVTHAYPRAMEPEYLGDFFSLTDAVLLEYTEKSMLGDILDVALVGDSWFVLDWQKSLYRFDIEGRFLGTVGTLGQGPGEYQDPAGLLTWDDTLVVDDAGTGALVIYDAEGHYMRSLNLRDQGVYIRSAHLFQGDRWYVGHFGSIEGDVPAHALVSMATGEPKLVHGFGERFAWAYRPDNRKKFPALSEVGFAMVEGRVWVAPPYRSTINVYDSEGRLVSRLPTGVEMVEEEDYRELDTVEDLQRLHAEKHFNGPIMYVPPFVFVTLHRLGRNRSRTAVYDAEGNLIRKGLPGGPGITGYFLIPAGPYLVTPVPTHLGAEDIRSGMSEDAWSILEKAGYDPETFGEGNPMLLLSVLRGDLKGEGAR